jgi:sugar phosphate permease
LTLLFLRDPPRGALDVVEGGATPPKTATPAAPPSSGALLRIPSYLFNTAAQIIYTFVVGGLATWMPTYFVRVRHLPLASADLMFGGVLAAAGLVGTLIGGRLGDRMAARHPSGHFQLAGVSLLLSVPFAVAGIVAPSPAIFWPAMFVALTLLFLNTGPLNAAMANVLPAQLRGWGFAMYTMAIHLLGDGASPTVIGFASDRMGLKLPVLVTVTLPFLAGLVLLAGRSALTRDLARSGAR